VSEIDLIIKIRDGAQMIADACAEWLEKQIPKEEPSQRAIKVVPKEEPYNALPWTDGQGPRGPYQMVKDDGSDLYRHLKAQLKQNKGRLSLTTHYYWLGSQGDIIFRRAKKK